MHKAYHENTNSVNAAVAVQCALAAAGIDAGRYPVVVAYESTDAAGNPTVETRVQRGIGYGEAFVPLRRDHNDIPILTGDPWFDDRADLTDEQIDERHDMAQLEEVN
jgi:hypothetical protein